MSQLHSLEAAELQESTDTQSSDDEHYEAHHSDEETPQLHEALNMHTAALGPQVQYPPRHRAHHAALALPP